MITPEQAYRNMMNEANDPEWRAIGNAVFRLMRGGPAKASNYLKRKEKEIRQKLKDTNTRLSTYDDAVDFMTTHFDPYNGKD